MDGWIDDLRFYVLFNSISVISGQWADDNEKLCKMKRNVMKNLVFKGYCYSITTMGQNI